MNLLAIECSTEVLSVAVWSAGEVCERADAPGPRHGDRLLPLIDAVLADARINKLDLAAVAFGCGPGAFTGVRMAVAAAQGIGYAISERLLRSGAAVALWDLLQRSGQAPRLRDFDHAQARAQQT